MTVRYTVHDSSRNGRTAAARLVVSLTVVLWLIVGLAAPGVGHAAPERGLVQEGAGGSTPSDAELDDLAARVAGELRCPVCRNQAVGESSAELSREMQAVIRERLAAGDTPEQVKEYFVARYGEWILLKPEARGVNLLVYVLPILTFLVGGLLVWRLLRRWSGGAPARLAGATPGGAVAGMAGAAEDDLATAAADPASVDRPAEGEVSTSAKVEPASPLTEQDEAWLEKAVSES